MKVLAISASPRKCGNAEVLCDEFLKGAAKGAKVGKGLAIHGGSVDGARAALEKWVQEGE